MSRLLRRTQTLESYAPPTFISFLPEKGQNTELCYARRAETTRFGAVKEKDRLETLFVKKQKAQFL